MGLKMKDKKTIIFDLDGTLAIIDKRRILAGKTVDGVPTDKMDWDVFFDPDNVLNLDEPNPPVIKMAQLFKADGFKIVIFSGRNDRSFDTTTQWLNNNDVPFDLLVMRPDKFKDKSWPIASGDDVFMTVDDRQKVVDMWRAEGLTCFQVAPGDF